MKKIISMAAGLFAVLSSGVIVNAAITNKTVDVSATVSAVSDMTTVPTLTATDVTAANVAFGSVASNVAAWSTLAPQYVKVVANNNAISWRLRLTTKNFAVAPPVDKWGYAYGGLKGAAESAKVPLAWRVSTGTVLNVAPTSGNPAVLANGWTFIKDQMDINDPATAGTDESFATSDAAGYCNIAFGSASSTIAIAAPPSGLGAVGQVQLPSVTTPFKVFINGNFNGAGATSYSTILNFDLIYQ